MQLSRRGFINGLVASATIAEAGILAEFLNFLRRKPKSFTAPAGGWVNTLDSDTMYFSNDGKNWINIGNVTSIEYYANGPKLYLYKNLDKVCTFQRGYHEPDSHSGLASNG